MDIPHQTIMQKCIIQTSKDVLANLALDIEVRLYLILFRKTVLDWVSFTTDLWCDPDKKYYMAVMTHCVGYINLSLLI